VKACVSAWWWFYGLLHRSPAGGKHEATLDITLGSANAAYLTFFEFRDEQDRATLQFGAHLELNADDAVVLESVIASGRVVLAQGQTDIALGGYTRPG